jgi:hypothetical protein
VESLFGGVPCFFKENTGMHEFVANEGNEKERDPVTCG